VDCNEVLEQLAEYLDEEARTELCKAIDEHLIHCRDCRFEVDTLKKTIVLYHEDSRLEMPVRAGKLLRSALASEYEQTNGEEIRQAD
jgi:predicted anti-sigma-YlaC factor YlaD